MPVAPVSLPPSSPTGSAAAGRLPSQEIGEEQFLSLLMAQLSNQDPLNPMEAAQFLDQIATMNSVKQLMDANSRLDSLLLGMTSLNNESAVDLVGRKVVARADEFSHTAGEAEELLFELGKDSKDVTITEIGRAHV